MKKYKIGEITEYSPIMSIEYSNWEEEKYLISDFLAKSLSLWPRLADIIVLVHLKENNIVSNEEYKFKRTDNMLIVSKLTTVKKVISCLS